MVRAPPSTVRTRGPEPFCSNHGFWPKGSGPAFGPSWVEQDCWEAASDPQLAGGLTGLGNLGGGAYLKGSSPVFTNVSQPERRVPVAPVARQDRRSPQKAHLQSRSVQTGARRFLSPTLTHSQPRWPQTAPPAHSLSQTSARFVFANGQPVPRKSSSTAATSPSSATMPLSSQRSSTAPTATTTTSLATLKSAEKTPKTFVDW